MAIDPRLSARELEKHESSLCFAHKTHMFSPTFCAISLTLYCLNRRSNEEDAWPCDATIADFICHLSRQGRCSRRVQWSCESDNRPKRRETDAIAGCLYEREGGGEERKKNWSNLLSFSSHSFRLSSPVNTLSD